ncbi:uncharacterized protein [Rutidosis leptorrhynchoides]|uniref:uncharacterized protein n=1 Tax=Rutidosis leptorrhynchoides TaxID=125765 RepID=UPI003A992022
MSQSNQSEADMTPESDNDCSNEMTEYEKQRMKRIEENKARMKSMGLDKAATLFMGSIPISQKSNKKGKKKLKVEDDEEYNPSDKDEESSSSNDDELYVSPSKSKPKKSTPSKKNSKLSGNLGPTPSKKPLKLSGNSDFITDDDDALMKAIALSLQDSSGFLDVGSKTPPQSSDAKASIVENTEKKQIVCNDESGKRKRKNSFTGRVKMTDDELILHFFQFDEAGKGGINLRDLRRVAASHDFTWNDEEMLHMIQFFDTDEDGKLSLDDFTKIVERCNMKQGSESAEQASVAS